MKQTCLVCERTSPDKNLYCQDVRCPAELSPLILDYGEWLGDIEIVKPVAVLRTSVLYEARRQRTHVLLKVAHPGQQHTDRLKREAEFLREQGRRGRSEHLPVLLPPYADAALEAGAYGRAALRGQLLYFCLYEHFVGEPLRDVLKKNPQLWINHVGWIALSLAAAVAVMHSAGKLHLGVTPESLLVRFDETPNVPRALLFDLGLVTEIKAYAQDGYPGFAPAAYTPPELLAPPHLPYGYQSDVYGIGLSLYEMLVGEPAFAAGLRSDDRVQDAVRQGAIAPMSRFEDVAPVAAVAEKAVARAPAQRHESAAQLAAELIALFKHVPPPKRSIWPSVRTAMLIVIVILGVAFAAAVVAAIAGIASGASLDPAVWSGTHV